MWQPWQVAHGRKQQQSNWLQWEWQSTVALMVMIMSSGDEHDNLLLNHDIDNLDRDRSDGQQLGYSSGTTGTTPPSSRRIRVPQWQQAAEGVQVEIYAYVGSSHQQHILPSLSSTRTSTLTRSASCRWRATGHRAVGRHSVGARYPALQLMTCFPSSSLSTWCAGAFLFFFLHILECRMNLNNEWREVNKILQV